MSRVLQMMIADTENKICPWLQVALVQRSHSLADEDGCTRDGLTNCRGEASQTKTMRGVADAFILYKSYVNGCVAAVVLDIDVEIC